MVASRRRSVKRVQEWGREASFTQKNDAVNQRTPVLSRGREGAGLSAKVERGGYSLRQSAADLPDSGLPVSGRAEGVYVQKAGALMAPTVSLIYAQQRVATK